MENNKNFFEWYKRKITESPQDPPADAWQNIADELDTNDVWDKVAVRLDNRGGWYFDKPWNYALPALLLLLISGGIYFYFDNFTRQTPPTTAEAYADADDSSGSQTVVTEDESADVTNKDEASADAKHATDGNISDSGIPEENVSSDKSKVAPGKANASDVVVSSDKTSPLSSTKAITDNGSFGPSEPVKEEVSSEKSIADAKTILPGEEKSQTEKAPVSERQASDIEIDTPRLADRDRSEYSTTTQKKLRRNDDTIAFEGNNNNDRKLPSETLEDDPTSVMAALQKKATATYDNAAAQYSTSSTRDKSAGPASSTQRLTYPSFVLGRVAAPDSILSISPLIVLLQFDSLLTPEAILPVDAPVFNRSLEFGISGSVKNTWLLNQTTFTGLERRSLTATLPDFGKDIGVAIRYNFAPLFTVQAEAFFISDIGQRYNEYRKGKYIEREVDLNYFHGNLLFKYGNNAMQLGRLVNGHGIIGGLYFSKLKAASETIDGHTTDIRDAYAPVDYGLVLGYEYNQHLFSDFFFTSGVRLNYGLNDIRPDASSRTSTGSFDVNFALRYRIQGL